MLFNHAITVRLAHTQQKEYAILPRNTINGLRLLHAMVDAVIHMIWHIAVRLDNTVQELLLIANVHVTHAVHQLTAIANLADVMELILIVHLVEECMNVYRIGNAAEMKYVKITLVFLMIHIIIFI